MIKCTIKFYALHGAIFRFISFRQKNKANVTLCCKITYLDIYTQECLTKSKMLPRIQCICCSINRVRTKATRNLNRDRKWMKLGNCQLFHCLNSLAL